MSHVKVMHPLGGVVEAIAKLFPLNVDNQVYNII